MDNQTYMKEYSNSSTNPRACYSSLNAYGVGGKYISTIINPQPAAVTPQLFWRLQQHQVPAFLVRNQHMNHCQPSFNSSPYARLHVINQNTAPPLCGQCSK